MVKIGAIVGGIVAELLGIETDNIIGSIIIATLGAILILSIVNVFSAGRPAA